MGDDQNSRPGASLDILRSLRERVREASGADLDIDHEIDRVLQADDGHGVPLYTASIDAAIGLVERVLPGFNVHVFSDCDSYFARVENFEDSRWVYTSGFDGEGDNRERWCLSLIDAALSALITRAEAEDPRDVR